jgi:hypothetical protein
VKITEGVILTEFEEEGFRLDVFHKGNIYMYHPCSSEGNNVQILLPSEIKHQKCMYCGPLGVPGELMLLWEFLHEGREHKE